MESGKSPWIHVLLKGDQSEATDNQIDTFMKEFERHSMMACLVRPLRFDYTNLDKLKTIIDQSASSKTTLGLILTSPRAVQAILKVLNEIRHEGNFCIRSLFKPSCIFPIGAKTASTWFEATKIDYNLHTESCGDISKLVTFIKEYLTGHPEPCELLYPKGSLTDQTVEHALVSRFNNKKLHPIVVYETNVIENLSEEIVQNYSSVLDRIQRDSLTIIRVNLIFFSPSGFRGFADQKDSIFDGIRSKSLLTTEFHYSSIGHTTAKALQDQGLEVFCVADKPNASSLVECIQKKCSTF